MKRLLPLRSYYATLLTALGVYHLRSSRAGSGAGSTAPRWAWSRRRSRRWLVEAAAIPASSAIDGPPRGISSASRARPARSRHERPGSGLCARASLGFAGTSSRRCWPSAFFRSPIDLAPRTVWITPRTARAHEPATRTPLGIARLPRRRRRAESLPRSHGARGHSAAIAAPSSPRSSSRDAARETRVDAPTPPAVMLVAPRRADLRLFFQGFVSTRSRSRLQLRPHLHAPPAIYASDGLVQDPWSDRRHVRGGSCLGSASIFRRFTPPL
jgi:hypothetical protein